MKKRLLYKRLAIITFVLVFCLVITVFALGRTITEDTVFDLVDWLFDDTRLTRDSTPIGWDPSTPLLMGCVPPADIQRIVFVRMPPIVRKQEGTSKYEPLYGYFNWGHQYPGFPKVELTRSQLEELLSAFRETKLFSRQNVKTVLSQNRHLARDYPDHKNHPAQAVVDRIAHETRSLEKAIQKMEYHGTKGGHVAELQIYLPRRRIARFEIYWDKETVAFSTGFSYEVSVSGLGPESLDLVSSYHELTRTPPLQVEFPEETSQSALKRARQKFGKFYGRVVDELKHGEELESIFGPIDEIRPAKGRNHQGAWADASWATYTFRVSSKGKQGLVSATDREKQLLYNETIYEL